MIHTHIYIYMYNTHTYHWYIFFFVMLFMEIAILGATKWCIAISSSCAPVRLHRGNHVEFSVQHRNFGRCVFFFSPSKQGNM